MCKGINNIEIGKIKQVFIKGFLGEMLNDLKVGYDSQRRLKKVHYDSWLNNNA